MAGNEIDIEGSVPTTGCCPVVELRRYRLQPGQRDVLVELFDRAFVESQETVGMRVVGQFRDLDDPDRFVFVRGFRNMPARAEALAAFYEGPVWAAHREAANATMLAWDDVLLLRPARPGSGFVLDAADRPPPGVHDVPGGIVVATVYHLAAPASDALVDRFEEGVRPVLTGVGASVVAAFVTEPSPNTHPALPIREGEHVFVWFAGFPDPAASDRHLAALDASVRWRGWVSEAMAGHAGQPPAVLKLAPTPRSLLRG